MNLKKRVLITGKNGYISNSLKKYIENKTKDFQVELLDLRRNDWENDNFSDVLCIVHTAALVHKNMKKYSLDEYRETNTILTERLAKKAKEAGVGHFVFLSTSGVYGAKINCFRPVVIDENTVPNPYTKYGISKLEAENLLREMENDNFKVAILRPFIVYGKDCTGNYQVLKKLALSVGMGPKMTNGKAVLYIDNLCECIYQIISKNLRGLFPVQNKEIVSTSYLAEIIAKYNGKRFYQLRILNPFVKAASLFVDKLNTAFGSEYYSEEFAANSVFDYNVINFEESIKASEEG